MTFAIQPLQPQQQTKVLTAFCLTFVTSRTPAVWRWLYDSCPDGTRQMLAWSASGDLAAHYAASCHQLSNGRMAGQSRDVFSLPHYRGTSRRGVLVQTAQQFFATCGQELSFIWGFPSHTHYRLGQLLLGYQPLGPWQHLQRRVSHPVGPPVTLAAMRELQQFDQGFDALWHQRKFAFPLAVQRDSRYLNWRFNQDNGRGYWRFACYSYRASTPLGYVVLAPRANATAWLVDFLLPPAEFNLWFWQELDAILDWRGIQLIQCWCSYPCPDQAQLGELGFLPIPLPTDFVPSMRLLDGNCGDVPGQFYFNMSDSDLC